MHAPVTIRLVVLAAAAASAPVVAQIRPYRAIDLGPVPGASALAGVTSAAISEDGSAVGGASSWDPYVWRPGAGMLALQVASGFLNGGVYDVNNAGEAVGSCGLPTISFPTTAARWSANGSVQLLGTLGGLFSSAVGMNNVGVVVGSSELSGTTQRHAFRWSAQTGMVDLTPGSPLISLAQDVNDAGQVLLTIGTQAYRDTPGVGLESLGGVEGFRINEFGQVAGRDMQSGVAGRYTDGIGWQMFAAGSSVNFSQIGEIDGLGRIVGTQVLNLGGSPPQFQRRGYVWSEGLGFQRLDDLVLQSPQPVSVTAATGITDTGLILAHGSIGPDNRTFLLEPRFIGDHGPGCAPAGARTPRLGALGVPTGGGTIELSAAAGYPGSVGVFVVSLQSASASLPNGCPVLVDPNNALLPAVVTNPIGQATTLLTLPSGAPQVRIYAQWATLDLGQGLPSLALSNALTIDVQ